MKPIDMRIDLAKLDGFTPVVDIPGLWWDHHDNRSRLLQDSELDRRGKAMSLTHSGGYYLPDYLYSYDAIIPLVHKLCGNTTWARDFVRTLATVLGADMETQEYDTYFISTMVVAPAFSLCEAVLRASGTWIDTPQ